MADVGGLATIDEVFEALRAHVRSLPVTHLPLTQAMGSTLAEVVVSRDDHPPFDRALMDGFAVRSADVPTAGTRLRLTGEVAMGAMASGAVGPGEAMRISTGGALPAGADAVVMVEKVETSADGASVEIQHVPTVGEHVLRQGASLWAGKPVLEAGTRLTGRAILAAGCAGVAEVAVYRRPSLAVLSTGDELVPCEQIPSPGKVRDGNRPALLAMAGEYGCETADLGIARDDPAELRERMTEGLQRDVLCLSGGVSMGPRDFVPAVLAELGVTFFVRKARVKPGKPIHLGRGPRGQLVCGLPGNPVSSFVGFKLFVAAGLALLQGREPDRPKVVQVPLTAGLAAGDARAEFVPGQLERGDGPWKPVAGIMPVAHQGSADPFAWARADAMILRGPADRPRRCGEPVNVLLL